MAPPRRRRFLECDDLEAKRAEEENVIREYGQQPLDDCPDIASVTEERREGWMREWRDYFKQVLKLDPDSIWLDLCLNRDLAKDRSRAFLRRFVKDSAKQVPTLGPEEYELKRTLNSANSLLNVWRGLIAQADATVLLAKRQEDRSNEDTWRLKFMDHTNRKGHGPVFEISKWIFKAGAVELGLCTELTVEKIEATAEDVITIANTVWERAKAVPCAPTIRVAFLAMLLLAGIGGFRPKALLRFPFEQIQLAVVRHPKYRSRTTIAVTFRVPIIKKRRSSRGTQPKWITFTIFFVPVPSICLASLVTSLAIKADAFEPSIDSVETLLRRPNLEGVDYLPLKWKKEILKTPIFPLDYRTYRKIWHQGCLAAGLRSSPRLYTLRVGVGMDLDGVLADVLRNYVMSNTSAVFQKSYQAEHVRVNLLETRFKQLYPDEGMWDDGLERAMRTMSLRRDPNAPVAPAPEELQSFELRKDVSDLRERLGKAKAANRDRRTWNALFMQLRNLIQYLSDLTVKARRSEYFERVDRLRALGQSTLEGAAITGVSRTNHVKLCHGGEALNEVVRFIRRYSYSTDAAKVAKPYCQERWLDLLFGYLTNQPAVANTEEGGEGEVIVLDLTGASGPPQDQTSHICFLCRSSLSSRDALTVHCKAMHVDKGTFNQAFPCPECRRRGIPDHLITNTSSWSSHVETVHGEENAPNLRTQPYSTLCETKSCCPFCGLYLQKKGFGQHTKSHVRAGAASAIFSSPFPCLACRNGQGDKKQNVVIDGCSAWNAHVLSAHCEVARNWSVGESSEGKKEPMCLLCGRSFSCRSTLTAHCKKIHVKKGTFSQPFPCPECRRSRSNMPDHLITSAASWSSHVEKVHGVDRAPNLPTDPTSNETKLRCPLCGLYLLQQGFYAHFRSHVRNGAASAIFTTAFPCLCCSRDEQGDDEKQGVMINGCLAWDAHVSVAHGEVARIWTVDNYVAVRKRKRQAEVEEITMVQSRECSATAQDVVTTPASTDEPHTETQVSSQGFDILLIDPLLLDEDRKRMKRKTE